MALWFTCPPLHVRLALATTLLLLTRQNARADEYLWEGGSTGNFSDSKWFDVTTSKHMVGPPGANDRADDESGATLTITGGSVQTLEGTGGSGFNLTGNFSTTTLLAGGSTISGPGKLTAGTVTLEGTGGSLFFVQGGHLEVNGSVTKTSPNVTSGGSLVVHGAFSNEKATASGVGSTIDALSGFSNVSIFTNAGGHITTASVLNNMLNVSSALDGAGSLLSVTGSFTNQGSFLDITGGAILNVGNNLTLDGLGSAAGGGNWTDAGTNINVARTLTVGNSQSLFSIAIRNGAIVKAANVFVGANSGSTGSIDLAGTGSLLEAFGDGMAIGDTGSGTVNTSAGAKLLLDSGTAFAVGLSAGGHGTLTLTGTNTLVDCRNAAFSVGEAAGSNGSVMVQNGARLAAGVEDFFIGDSGFGTLSVSSGGQVNVTGSNTKFGIGEKVNSTGVVVVQGSGSLLTSEAVLLIGNNGKGTLSLGNSGKIQNSLPVGLGGGSSGNGVATVSGPGTLWTADGMFVGYTGGVGKLTVQSGGRLDVLTSGRITRFGIGDAAGTSGEVDIDGSGSIVNGNGFIVGINGAGTLKITNGGVLQVDDAAVGLGPGSSGNVTVSGPGSTWNLKGIQLLIGGDPGRPGEKPAPGGPAVVTVSNGGTISVRKALFILPPGKVVISGGSIGVGANANPAPNTLRVASEGFLLGPGRVQGQVVVAQGGRIKSGNSPGIANIDGNYQQQSGSTFDAEIGGPAAGTGYDQINVTGTATLSGGLSVHLINGFTPTVGQTFRILNAASLSGSFSPIVQPSQAAVAVTKDATGVTLTITSVVAGAPVISSPTTVSAIPGTAFSYQIKATNSPTSFGAANLPPGLSVNHTTGLISGTPNTSGVFVVPINANNTAGSGQADLTFVVSPDLGGSGASATGWTLITAGDFNGDGHPDYVLFNPSTNRTAVWYLRNNVFQSGVYGPTLPPGWAVACVADVNLDGHPDYVLFQPSTDRTAVWFMNNITFIRGAYGPTLPTGWILIAAGDFNGDGHPDYVLFNPSTNRTAVWYLNSTALTGSAYGPTLPSGWTLVDAKDFDANSKPDFVLFQPTTRQSAIWYLNGTSFGRGSFGPALPAGWTLRGTADFDGDRKPDYLLLNATTRQTAIWYLNGVAFTRGTYGPPLPATR